MYIDVKYNSSVRGKVLLRHSDLIMWTCGGAKMISLLFISRKSREKERSVAVLTSGMDVAVCHSHAVRSAIRARQTDLPLILSPFILLALTKIYKSPFSLNGCMTD